MGWRELDVCDERRKFIEDWLKREFTFIGLCNRFGISRKTGYKLLQRFRREGDNAFQDQSRARVSQAHAISSDMELKLLNTKARYPLWGPRKIRDFLIQTGHVGLPASSTVGDIFKRHGLVKSRKIRRKSPPHLLPLKHCVAPNIVWSADFKGQFELGNGQYCYPLTITDNYSRYLFSCHAMSSPILAESMKVFRRAFEEYGLPEAIRTDNGQPFAGLSVGGLTQMSIWWLKLGIIPERIAPGKPQQNGRHERMHRTLKEAAIKPPEFNLQAQQKRFDTFIREYNEQRPHQALNGQRPKELHKPSMKKMPSKMPEICYPDNFKIRKVRTSGEIQWYGKKYSLTQLLHGEPIGLEEIDDGRAIVHFASLKLGLIDARKDRIDRL
jgi:transposase InsO family protein